MTNNLHKIATQGALTTILTTDYIGKAGELTLDTGTGIIYFHDGMTPGGSPVGGSGGGSSVGSAGVLQMSDGSGGFVVSDFLDLLTVPGSATASLVDAAGQFGAPGLLVEGAGLGLLVIGPTTAGLGVLEVDGFGAGTPPAVSTAYARGTRGVPTAALNGDVLFDLNAQAYDGASYDVGMDFLVTARQDFSGGANKTSIDLTNASSLGLHVAADGTFTLDTGWGNAGGGALAQMVDSLGAIIPVPGVTVRGTSAGALSVGPTETGTGFFVAEGFGSTAGGSGLLVLTANGTRDAPTEVLSGKVLSTLSVSGYDGSSYQLAAQMFVTAQSDFSGTPTSSFDLINASGLGFHVAADGTFSTDTGVVTTNSGNDLVLIAAPDTGGGGGTSILRGTESVTDGVHGGVARVEGGDATTGNADGGDIILRSGNKSGTGQYGTVDITTYAGLGAHVAADGTFSTDGNIVPGGTVLAGSSNVLTLQAIGAVISLDGTNAGGSVQINTPSVNGNLFLFGTDGSFTIATDTASGLTINGSVGSSGAPNTFTYSNPVGSFSYGSGAFTIATDPAEPVLILPNSTIDAGGASVATFTNAPTAGNPVYVDISVGGTVYSLALFKKS